jgi:ubiquinone/menaquinone biosynthesis C-methylase UbiE
MDPRLQRRVQRYGWDKAAAYYEPFWARQLAPAQERLLALAALRPGEQVLELAAGTGLVTFPVAEAVGPGGRVVATDISEAMVTQLGAAAAARGLVQVSTERTDAEDLRWEDGSFDAVLCALGLMYVADPGTCLRQSWRVLRAGGRMVAAVWGARKNCGWAEIFPIVDRRVSSEVCPLFFQLGTGRTLAQTMEEAGFVQVTEERLFPVLEYATAEDALGAAFAGGPVALAYSRFDDATREEVHAEYLDSIAPWRAGEGYRIPGEFVVARGLKS